MVLHIPIAAEFFYNYLEEDTQQQQAPIYFALYADLRYYDKACTDYEDEQQKFEIAQAIFQEYLCE